jgi:hypothetical protein
MNFFHVVGGDHDRRSPIPCSDAIVLPLVNGPRIASKALDTSLYTTARLA